MRHVAIAALLIVNTVCWCSLASAQALEDLKQRAPDAIASDQTDFWSRTLDLDPGQTSALEAVNLRYAQDMTRAARTKRTDSQKRATIDTLEQARQEEVVELLTPAQQKRYDEITGRMEQWLAERAR